MIGLWARFGTTQIAELPASSSWAQLVAPDGSVQNISPQNGVYRITLPPATNLNTPGNPYAFGIGGKPYLLIEGDTKVPAVTAGALRDGTDINIGWQGVDNYLGSGIQDYTVRVSVNNGQPWTWLNQTTDEFDTLSNTNTTATYKFYVTVRDNAGNVSPVEVVTVEGSAGNFAHHLHLPLIFK